MLFFSPQTCREVSCWDEGGLGRVIWGDEDGESAMEAAAAEITGSGCEGVLEAEENGSLRWQRDGKGDWLMAKADGGSDWLVSEPQGQARHK